MAKEDVTAQKALSVACQVVKKHILEAGIAGEDELRLKRIYKEIHCLELSLRRYNSAEAKKEAIALSEDNV